MRTVRIAPPHALSSAPVPGARMVWWLIDGHWVHVGWLMPQVSLVDLEARAKK